MEETVSRGVIGAAIEVHRHLGPGLLESTYQVCLAHELALQGIAFTAQAELPVMYKGVRLDFGYRMDLLVADTLVVEVKSAASILPIHKAQLLTYLRMGGFRVGLLLNFNERLMKDGILRLVN